MTKDVVKTFRPSPQSLITLDEAQADGISITDAINEGLELWAEKRRWQKVFETDENQDTNHVTE
jgi:hypothetical protein